MQFNIQATDPGTKARTGQLFSGRGIVNTPIFMPVGTLGTVKAIHHRELVEDIRAEIILGNTYHLYLRPGMEILELAGGLHTFMHWDKPILTDSGGYQVYSLADNRKITEDGVSFSSHIDGSKHFFSPENVIDIQRRIGADIIMAFDECTPFPCDYDYARSSMELTHRWLKRCQQRFENTSDLYVSRQALFPIVQGSVYPDLRKQSAETIAGFEMDGNAIGGLSVGEPADIMYEITEQVCDVLPAGKPRYLMGVGTPENILECIALGIDMFDCVMPTRNARNGMLFTTSGIINIRNEKWKNDFSPLDAQLEGYVSQHYSKAYLRHLVLSREILGAQIASLQNLSLYHWVVRQAREYITKGTFLSWKNQMTSILSERL
ncbi:MAG: tRNA guanosine(34) transglycosylase Tgt [Cyclobacteriaceae bacterium]|nr:tRNA guanosine(34) transglycosylase Tgt [Cyclobacteriaceae bacterium]